MEHPLYITGDNVRLRPATLDDRYPVYWAAAHSDITDALLGHPDWEYTPLLSYEAFCEVYCRHYWDDSNPEGGRCFIIESEGMPVGQIHYSAINRFRSQVALDLWLFARRHCGKGYGSEALDLLCTYLHDHFQVTCCYLKASASNRPALRACEKAGFHQTTLRDSQAAARFGEKNYFDTVYLTRLFTPHSGTSSLADQQTGS